MVHKKKSVSALFHEAKTRWHRFRLKRHNESPTDNFARRTANATVFLAITSAATVGLLWIQLSEMHLDQRAWLGIERGERFDFKSGQDFSVVFDMTNTGKTPALHVKKQGFHEVIRERAGIQSDVRKSEILYRE
jgi:hypothetical protein